MKPSIVLCAFVFSAAAGGIRAQDSSSDQKLREEIVSLRQAQEDLRLKLRELELQNRELMVTIREMRLDMQLLAERMRRPAAPVSNLEVEPASPPEAEGSKEEARLEVAKVHTAEPEPAPAPPPEIDAKQKEVADLLKLGIDTANKQRDYAQAVEILSKVIALDPHEHQAFFYRGVAHHYLKHYVEAMADFTTAAENSEPGPVRLASLYNIACGHAVLGNRGHALNLLEKALSEGFREFAHIREDPDMQSIRDDPRFIELMKTYENKNTEEGP
jgi:tetratricopeptide (TPR) repeat protein